MFQISSIPGLENVTVPTSSDSTQSSQPTQGDTTAQVTSTPQSAEVCSYHVCPNTYPRCLHN